METTKHVLGKSLGDGELTNFSAGFTGQLAGSVFWVPSEVLKEKLNLEGQIKTTSSFQGPIGLANHIVKKEGVRGLYRGFWLQQATYAPFNGLGIMFFNRIKQYVPEENSGVASDFAASFLGYSTAAAITTPVDVVKTRMQVRTSNPELLNYTNSYDCAKKIFQHEGGAGFLKGMSGRVGWLAPRNSVAMTAFQFLYRHLNKTED